MLKAQSIYGGSHKLAAELDVYCDDGHSIQKSWVNTISVLILWVYSIVTCDFMSKEVDMVCNPG